MNKKAQLLSTEVLINLKNIICCGNFIVWFLLLKDSPEPIEAKQMFGMTIASLGPIIWGSWLYSELFTNGESISYRNFILIALIAVFVLFTMLAGSFVDLYLN